MSRKHCNRRRVVALPPRGLRPVLDQAQQRDLDIVNHVNLDTIHRGEADESTLWEVVGGVLTWLYVAMRLQLGMVEMDEQMALVTRLVERYRDTGRIEFAGEDYDLARAGVEVMRQLAQAVDKPTAIAAAEWSELRVERMSEGCHA